MAPSSRGSGYRVEAIAPAQGGRAALSPPRTRSSRSCTRATSSSGANRAVLSHRRSGLSRRADLAAAAKVGIAQREQRHVPLGAAQLAPHAHEQLVLAVARQIAEERGI